MATFPYQGFPDGVAYPTIPLGSTTVNVSTSAQLTTALSNATAGQRIVLANGTYSGAFTVTKAGTSSAGISIEAASQGGAAFASGSTWNFNTGAAYVTLKGCRLPYELTSGNTVQFRGTAHHCRVTRCSFGPSSVGTPGANKTPFIFIGDKAEHIRIDHNDFVNKANPGNAIVVDGDRTVSPEQVCKHIRVDHNRIQSIKPEVDNEKEPIRFGWSGQSKSHSYSVVERNWLGDCICEPEVISIKASSVRVTGNTIYKSIGGLVYRHGTNGIVSDNYIVDDQVGGGSTPAPTTGEAAQQFGWGTPLSESDEFTYSGTPTTSKWELVSGTAQTGVGSRSTSRVTVNGSAMVVSGTAGSASTGVALHNKWQRYGRWEARARVTASGTGTDYKARLLLWPADNVIVPRTAEQDRDPEDSQEYPWPHTVGLPGDRVKVHVATSALTTRYRTITEQACAAWSRSSAVEMIPVNACPVGSNCCTMRLQSIGDDEDTDGEADSNDSGGVRQSSTVTLYTDWMDDYADSEAFVVTAHELGHVIGLHHRNKSNDLMNGTTGPSTPTTIDLVNFENLVSVYESGGGGQYAFLETTPSQGGATISLGYPTLSGSATVDGVTVSGLDVTQWHNYAIEWTANEIIVWIDGVERLRRSGGGSSSRRAIQAHRGPMRLAAQLDAPATSGMRATQMEIEWARAYPLP